MQSLRYNTTGRCLRFTTLPRRHLKLQYCYATMSDDDPIVQYVALRRDLWKEEKWPLGSIVAQGCHAATAALWLSRDTEITTLYCSPDNLDHMRKVCCVVGWLVIGYYLDTILPALNVGGFGGIWRGSITHYRKKPRRGRNSA